MTKKIEWRHFFSEELRAVEESDGEPKIEGYPAMFNKYSEDLGGFVEKIAPGAFKKSLNAGADVRALWNHDSNYVLGRTKSGTTKLREDDKGLYMINRPPNTQWARDLMVSIGRKDVTQMSFDFWVVDEEWKERKDKPPVRTLNEVELIDVSVVTFPAYPDTKVALRSMEEWQKNVQDSTDKSEKNAFSFVDENEITVIDNEDNFIFRDFEQFDRIVAKVVEMKDKSDASQSRAEDKDEDIKDAQSRSEDVMERVGERVKNFKDKREKDWK